MLHITLLIPLKSAYINCHSGLHVSFDSKKNKCIQFPLGKQCHKKMITISTRSPSMPQSHHVAEQALSEGQLFSKLHPRILWDSGWSKSSTASEVSPSEKLHLPILLPKSPSKSEVHFFLKCHFCVLAFSYLASLWSQG